MSIYLVTFCVICSGATVASDKAPKPNIVHVLVDDLGWQDVACYKQDGKTFYETPHIDELASRGIRFMQAYSPAATCAMRPRVCVSSVLTWF